MSVENLYGSDAVDSEIVNHVNLAEVLPEGIVSLHEVGGLSRLHLYGDITPTRTGNGYLINAEWNYNSDHPDSMGRMVEFAERVRGVVLKQLEITSESRLSFWVPRGEKVIGVGHFSKLGMIAVSSPEDLRI